MFYKRHILDTFNICSSSTRESERYVFQISTVSVYITWGRTFSPSAACTLERPEPDYTSLGATHSPDTASPYCQAWTVCWHDSSYKPRGVYVAYLPSKQLSVFAYNLLFQPQKEHKLDIVIYLSTLTSLLRTQFQWWQRQIILVLWDCK